MATGNLVHFIESLINYIFVFCLVSTFSGLLWKIPLVILFAFILIFLYEHYTRGSMLRYWYCQRGCLKGGRTLSFVFTTHDRQVYYTLSTLTAV